LTLHIKEGRPYALGAVGFTNAQENPPLRLSVSQLREQFQLKQGEIFNVVEIRDGLRALTTLYGSRDYIDYDSGTRNASRL